MKIVLFIVLIILGFGLFQAYLMMTIRKTETQAYTVLRSEPEFEIRYYPEATMATISSHAVTYKELAAPGFRKLAGYIFGGNKGSKSIPMTSPVHMDIADTGSTMSFVMPSSYRKETLPAPDDTGVSIRLIPEEYVAALRFGGYASDTAIQRHTESLRNALDAASIRFHGNFRFLGYNPPFQWWGRKNEIIVSINKDLK